MHSFPNSHRPVSFRDDEARLHRRVRDRRRPPWRQDHRQPDWQNQQGRRHHAQVRHRSQGLREVGQQPLAIQAVRVSLFANMYQYIVYIF